MAVAKPTFTVGIEEEYLLVDLESRNLVNDPPASIMEECAELSGEQVSPELMCSQIEELLGLIAFDAEVLECQTEIQQARDILRRGTSAHQQLNVYDNAMQTGASKEEALIAVVDWLISETAYGL